MAMYYYANKLNEASCSSSRRTGRPPLAQPVPVPVPPPPPPPPAQSAIVADPALLRTGNALSYYDKDDYYSMVRGNKLMSESACQHIIMNGGINFVTTQKVDAPQNTAMMAQKNLTPQQLPFGAAEKPDVEYRDGLIISGTMEALVDMLRPGSNMPFKFTFILCSRLLLRPYELLSKLCVKYFKNYDRLKERGLGDAELLRNEKEDMRTLVAMLAEWTIMFPYDFRDERVMAIVRIMTERCSAEHMVELQVELSATLEKLLDKLTILEQYEETLNDVPQMSCVEHLAEGDILTLGLTPTALAHQLTLLELYRLSYIGPEEFIQTFLPVSVSPTMPPAPKNSIRMHNVDSKCTRNLESYAEWFNRLSYLVATDILKSPKSKYRARVIEQWVMTARECFNLGNFNSLMAIISALNMMPIARLKKTWNRTSSVHGQQLRQLELCVDPGGNHARYRAALAAAPSETAVPLLSVTCRDLHFANQGSNTKFGNRVDFEKWTVLSRFVEGQLASRQLLEGFIPKAAPAHRLIPVWHYLNDVPTLSETALELTSFERESPVDNHEKERMKRLRAAS